MSMSARGLRVYYFVTFSAVGVFMPYQPLWLDARGVTGWRMGFIVALRPIALVLAPVLFGVLADRSGMRGALLRWASGGALLSMVALAATCRISQPSFLALALGFLFFSLLRVPMASVADVATLESGESYGAVRLWGSLGFLFAAVVAGEWLDVTQPASYLVVVAALMFLAHLASYAVPATKSLPAPPRMQDALSLLKQVHYQRFLLAVFGWQLGHSAYDLCISLRLRDLGGDSTDVGVAWGIAVVAEVLLMAISGRLLRRWGTVRCLSFGMVGAAMRWLLLAWIPSVPLVMLSQPLHVFSFALVWVAAMQYVREAAEPHVLASAQGMAMTAMASGAALGMVGWGALERDGGASMVFLAAAGIGAAAACILFGDRWRAGLRQPVSS